MFDWYNSFHNNIFNLRKHRIIWKLLLLKVLPQQLKRPLGPGLILCLLVRSPILHILVVFIDAVVGEVDERIPKYFLIVWILLSGKTHESLLVDVDSQGVDAGDGNVDTEIELLFVDEHGVIDIVGYDCWLVLDSIPYLWKISTKNSIPTSSTSSNINIPLPYEDETGLQMYI